MTQKLEEVTHGDTMPDLRTVGESFLEHYGVKGMRWGVRKAPDPERSASRWKARKDREREAQAKSGKGAKGKSKADDEDTPKQLKAKKLSDQELRDSIARMQLEKQYNDLMLQTAPKRKRTKGQAFVEESKAIAASAARDAAKDVGTQLAKQYLREALGLPQPKKKK